jgi:hypothetical protein
VPSRLPKRGGWPGLLMKYGPVLAPYLKQLYAQGRFRQLAIVHARTIVDGTFSDERIGGERHWVVWSGDVPIAAYPEPTADLAEVLRRSRPDRRQDPDDLPVTRAMRRLADRAARIRAAEWRERREADASTSPPPPPPALPRDDGA